MLTERDLLSRVQRLTVTRLRVWVAQGWIKPAGAATQSYSEADLARAVAHLQPRGRAWLR